MLFKSTISFKGLDFLDCPEALQNVEQILSKTLYLKKKGREKEERENIAAFFKKILCSFHPINSLDYFSIHFSHDTFITFKKPESKLTRCAENANN